jgi:hypothetical protein
MRIRFLILLLISLLVLTGIVFTGCKASEEYIAESVAEATVVPEATTDISEIEPVSVDQEIDTGGIVWKVTGVEETGELVADNDYLLEAVRGKFVLIDFQVMNKTDEARILYDLSLIDDKGRVFNVCVQAYGFYADKKACTLQDIVPKVTNTFAAPFDVAPDSKGLVLEVTDLKRPPEEKEYVDLGI